MGLESILLISIFVRLIAAGLAFWMMRKLKDYRMGFLALMVFFMAVRQSLTLKGFLENAPLKEMAFYTELPGLAVSLLALLAVFALSRLLQGLKTTAERLQVESHRIEMAFNAAQMGTFEWDIKTGKIYWSENTETLFEMALSQLAGTYESYLFMLPAAERAEVEKQVEACIRTGKPFQVTHSLALPGGRIRWLRAKGQILRDQQNKPIRMIGIIQDITVEHKIRTELQRQTERTRMILNTTMDGYILADTRGQILDVNPAYCNLIGYSREELLTMNIEQLEGRLSPEKIKERIDAMVREGGARFETSHRHKNGQMIELEVSISIMQMEDEPLVAAFVRDITERKKTEHALRESEERYRKLVEIAPDAIAIHSEGKIVFCNMAAARLLGAQNPAQVIGMRVEKIVHPEGWEAARRRIERTFAGETGLYPVEDRYVRLDGRVIPVEVTVAPLTFMGKPAMQVIARDISERMRSISELQKSQSQLRALAAHLQNVREEERSMIAREIHDELGQVLTALKMDLSIVSRELAESGENRIGKIQEELSGMSHLIDQTIRRIRQIITRLRPQVLDHLGLIEAIEWQVEEFQSSTGIKCRLKIPSRKIDFPRPLSLALFRILQEALTNIARHSGASEAIVELTRGEDSIELKIRDNGKGFPPEAAEEKQSFGLLGIRERAIILGGEVIISSAPGKGTEIRVDVPLGSSQKEASPLPDDGRKSNTS